jgi:hypothetical protein
MYIITNFFLMQPYPKVLFQPFKISQKTNCLSLLAFVAFFEFDCSNLLSFYCFSKCICLSFWPPTTFFFKIHDLNFSPFVKFPFCNFFQNVCIFTYTGSYISKLLSLIQVFLYWEKTQFLVPWVQRDNSNSLTKKKMLQRNQFSIITYLIYQFKNH